MSPRCEVLRVTFRRYEDGEIIAIFPDSSDDCSNPSLRMCYQHIGQHGECDAGLIDAMPKAKPCEFASLLSELRGIYSPDYRLRVCR